MVLRALPARGLIATLPDGATEDDLASYFSRFGKVVEVIIKQHVRGDQRFAFCEDG